MKDDLVSKKTRNAFKTHLSNYSIKEIGRVFGEANIECNFKTVIESFEERECYVEELYNTLDLSNPVDVKKLLSVYESILEKSYPEEEEHLKSYLQKDGFTYRNSKIVPITPVTKKMFESISDRTITKDTRRAIFDIFLTEGISWAGRFKEPEFLGRLYDDDNMNDIWQHRVSFPEDYPDDYILTDPRFNLLKAPDSEFLIFLCETIHPAVRPNCNEVSHLLERYNQYLRNDGWEIISKTQISGKPVFSARRLLSVNNPVVKTAEIVLGSLSADYMDRQITRMQSYVNSDPEAAIGAAKEFIETICKTILESFGETSLDKYDFTELVKITRKKLDILPEIVPEKTKGSDSIKKILNSLGSITNELIELRKIWGTGHGKSAKTSKIPPRLANLAVGAACTLGIYIFEVYQMRKENKK